MKNTCFFILFWVCANFFTQAQIPTTKQKHDISNLIDQYTLAREKKDTVLLKTILTEDVDQLVSSGEWRTGINESIKGMLKSSQQNSGTRKITIDKLRLLNETIALVDTRYKIQNQDGTERKMWSTFILIYTIDKWRLVLFEICCHNGE